MNKRKVPPKRQVSIAFHPAELEVIDFHAKLEGIGRSEYLRTIVRFEMLEKSIAYMGARREL